MMTAEQILHWKPERPQKTRNVDGPEQREQEYLLGLEDERQWLEYLESSGL